MPSKNWVYSILVGDFQHHILVEYLAVPNSILFYKQTSQFESMRSYTYHRKLGYY